MPLVKPPIGTLPDLANPLARGLAGAWELREGAGPRAADSSGRNRTGTLHGGVIWTPGRDGPALDFDGTSGYVGCGPAIPITPEFAVECWFCSTALADNSQRLVCNGGNFWELYTSFSAGTASFGVEYAPFAAAQAGLEAGWNHLLGQRNGATGNLELWVNGQLAATAACAAPSTAASGNLEIGRFSGGGFYTRGQVGRVRLWTRSLSAGEVGGLYADGQGLFPPPSTRRYFVPTGGGGSPVTIAPTGIPSAESVGSPSLSPGPVAISPAGAASSEAVGTPSLSPGAVAISPTGIDSAESVGSPTLSFASTPAPLAVSGLVAGWLATEIPGATDGDPLGAWPDASGNGHDGSATGTQRPTYASIGVNALPVVEATADGQWLDLATPITLPDAYTLYVVASRAADNLLRVLASASGAATVQLNGTVAQVVDDTNSAASGFFFGGGGAYLWRFRRSGAGQPHRFAASALAEASIGTTGAATLDTLLGKSGTGQSTAAGDQFAAVLLYGRDLVGTADDADIQGYFADNRDVGLIPEPTPTIEPAGIPSSESVGTPTLTPGPVTIGPAGIASGESVGSPTITATAPGATTITPDGIPSAESVGTPSIAPGAVAIQPQGIASGEAVGTPTITATAPGAVTISPTGIASSEAVGTPTITPGPVTIRPSGIASAEAVGHPTIGFAVPADLAETLLAAIQAAFDAGAYGDSITGGLATVEQLTRVPMPFATIREKSTRAELWTSTSQVNAVELCVKVYAEDLDTAQELGGQLAGLFDGRTFEFTNGWTTKLTSQGDPRHDKERGWAIGGVPAWYQERTYHTRVRRART